VNGRYSMAETPEDRIAVAIAAAERKYRQEFPHGVTPGQTFLAGFLRPFIERELLAARVDELHRMTSAKTRERELVEALHAATAECQERISR
jgi:hypothetical protein